MSADNRITAEKIGGIWHGYLEGRPDVDERALTETLAREKVKRILDKEREKAGDGPSREFRFK